jgi:hypothetical protein
MYFFSNRNKAFSAGGNMRWGVVSIAYCILLGGCQDDDKQLDHLSGLKRDFIDAIFASEVEEDPFSFGYDIYEGKTFYKINGRFQEITLNDLFVTSEQKEFLRSHCERELKNQKGSYFSGEDPLRTRLEQEELRTFVVDDQFLMIIFQPYVAGGCADAPLVVKISYQCLKNQWNVSHPFSDILTRVITAQTFVASWDEDRADGNLEHNR